MTKFSAVTKERTAPPRFVVLPPDAFADTWAEKPQAEVAVGLRLVSESDVQAARSEAVRQAVNWYEGREGECIDTDARDDAYNDALMRWIVARCTCDPNDLRVPFFEMAEDTVRSALTSEGVRRLFDEYIKLAIGTGVSIEPADDVELEELASALKRPELLDKLEPGDRAEVRKLLAHCLEKLRPVIPHEPGDDDEDGVATYTTRRP